MVNCVAQTDFGTIDLHVEFYKVNNRRVIPVIFLGPEQTHKKMEQNLKDIDPEPRPTNRNPSVLTWGKVLGDDLRQVIR